MRIVRHAVSIAERRAFFRQNLFGPPHDATQDVKEVWFAGVHSDDEGSYAEGESQLSKIALRWMICEAELAGLRIDQQNRADILGADPHCVPPDPLTTNQHESLKGAWWIAEFWPKVVHVKGADGTWNRRLRINLGRRRWIEPNCVVHESVKLRLASTTPNYCPPNLPLQVGVENDKSAESTATNSGPGDSRLASQ